MRFAGRAIVVPLSAVAALALGGCSITFGEPRSTPTPTATSSAEPSPTSEPTTSVSAPGRLAVLGGDGSLYTVQPDGSARADLVEADGSEVSALQPAWSPDGDRLAWVVQEARDGVIGGAIAVAGPRGEDPIVTPTPFVPYYLSWSPTGDRVAFLGAGADPEVPVEMGVLDLRHEPARARTVAGGQPFFYFSWAPDGTRVLAHSGFDRLEEVDLSGQATRVSARPGLFATPAWSADGSTVVYAQRAGQGGQQLVAVVDGGRPKVLLEGRGALSFVLRPDGDAVAYQLLGEGDGDFFDRRPAQPDDGVRVVDVDTGVTKRATSNRAITFWWSPDSNRLLALAPEPAATGAIPFMWEVWDGGRAVQADGRHSPTLQVLRDYAPFFTQYAQSATPWAPDGSAFAFPVEDADGQGQIVVQEVDGEPVPIGEGVYVTWSP